MRWTGLALAGLVACVGDSATPTPDAGSTDAGNDVVKDAGPFSPAALPGLLFWMDGSKGVLADAQLKVNNWHDQSDAKNNANQPNANLQPKLASNVIAGHAAIQYPASGNDAYLDIGSPTKAFTGDFFVELVATSNLQAGQTGQLFYAGNPSGNNAQLLIENKRFEAGIYASTNKLVIMPTDYTPVTHLVFMRRAGTKFELGVDGTNLSISDAPTDAMTPLFRFGSGFDGLLAEVVGIDGTISPADQTALEAYLKAKYAL